MTQRTLLRSLILAVSPAYVVNDWRGHRLTAPPHGYQWQTGSDYVLIAAATGLIAQIVLSQ